MLEVEGFRGWNANTWALFMPALLFWFSFVTFVSYAEAKAAYPTARSLASAVCSTVSSPVSSTANAACSAVTSAVCSSTNDVCSTVSSVVSSAANAVCSGAKTAYTKTCSLFFGSKPQHIVVVSDTPASRPIKKDSTKNKFFDRTLSVEPSSPKKVYRRKNPNPRPKPMPRPITPDFFDDSDIEEAILSPLDSLSPVCANEKQNTAAEETPAVVPEETLPEPATQSILEGPSVEEPTSCPLDSFTPVCANEKQNTAADETRTAVYEETQPEPETEHILGEPTLEEAISSPLDCSTVDDTVEKAQTAVDECPIIESDCQQAAEAMKSASEEPTIEEAIQSPLHSSTLVEADEKAQSAVDECPAIESDCQQTAEATLFVADGPVFDDAIPSPHISISPVDAAESDGFAVEDCPIVDIDQQQAAPATTQFLHEPSSEDAINGLFNSGNAVFDTEMVDHLSEDGDGSMDYLIDGGVDKISFQPATDEAMEDVGNDSIIANDFEMENVTSDQLTDNQNALPPGNQQFDNPQIMTDEQIDAQGASLQQLWRIDEIMAAVRGLPPPEATADDDMSELSDSPDATEMNRLETSYKIDIQAYDFTSKPQQDTESGKFMRFGSSGDRDLSEAEMADLQEGATKSKELMAKQDQEHRDREFEADLRRALLEPDDDHYDPGWNPYGPDFDDEVNQTIDRGSYSGHGGSGSYGGNSGYVSHGGYGAYDGHNDDYDDSLIEGNWHPYKGVIDEVLQDEIDAIDAAAINQIDLEEPPLRERSRPRASAVMTRWIKESLAYAEDLSRISARLKDSSVVLYLQNSNVKKNLRKMHKRMADILDYGSFGAKKVMYNDQVSKAALHRIGQISDHIKSLADSFGFNCPELANAAQTLEDILDLKTHLDV